VAGHPTDVGRAPVDVGVGLDVEDEVVRRRDSGQVAPGRVDDPLRLPRRSRRVEDVEHVLGVEDGRLEVGRRLLHEILVDEVTPLFHRDVLHRAPDHEDLLDRLALLDRLVRALLERNDLTAPVTAVGRDQNLAFGVVDAVAQRLGGEPCEHDRMRRSDPCAGKHRCRQLRDHRQIDGDAIALLHAEIDEDVRETADLFVEVAVGDDPGIAGLADPVVSDPLGVVRQVAVETVVGGVDLASREPAMVRGVPLEDALPRLEPVEPLGLRLPPGVGILGRLLVDRGVLRVGLLDELGRRLERATFLEQRLDCLVYVFFEHLFTPESDPTPVPAAECELDLLAR
jgi:hypothetical protein